MDERQLITSAQNGDLNDFRLLMEQHAHMIWRVMKVLVADPVLAEDRVQESWVEIWKKLPDFAGDYSFRAWLLVIIAACAKKRMRRQPLTFLDPFLTYQQDGEELSAPYAANKGVDTLLMRLPLQQSRFLKLHFYAGLNAAEIAVVLHVPLKEVKACRQEAFQRLKALFAEDHAMNMLLRSHLEVSNE